MNRRPTAQDITWLLDLAKNGQLDLDPPYQRRSVWTRKDKQFFLDTIFRNYPSPAIFLHKSTSGDGKTVYHVVDGKQRLQTILDFVDGKIRIGDDFGDVRLNGKRWGDIQGEQELKHRLWNYEVTVEFLAVVEEGLVNSVFDRLNRNSRKLTAQELRHARFEGWFITTAETEAKSDDWKKLCVVTPARATRMADTQFISELMLVALERKMLGFDQDALNEFYGKYDDPDNPENPTENFNEDEFMTRFGTAKRYLLAMEKINDCISQFTKQYYAFYTLWAAVVLQEERLGPAESVAPKYSAFMAKVERLSQEKNLPEFLALDTDRQYGDAYSYYTNTRGANTDLPALPPSGLLGVIFEVQIKTFLQHAWSIATHDLVYKTDAVSWSKQRIAFQIKAMLEHAEVSIQEAERLADCDALAKTDHKTEITQAYIKLLTSQWDVSDLPNDVRRLAENISGLMEIMKFRVQQLERALKAERDRGRGSLTKNLSPYAVVVQTLMTEYPKQFKNALMTSKSPRQRIVIPAELQLPADIDKNLCLNAIFLDRR